MYSLVVMKSFHCPTPLNKAIVAMAGMDSGINIFRKMRQSPAPSILADSSSESGTFRKKFIRMTTS
ncbi:hypothetical protein D3C76_1795090 [compost metagenome]